MNKKKRPVKTKRSLKKKKADKHKKLNWWRESTNVMAKFLGPLEIERLFRKDYAHISIEPMYYAVFLKSGKIQGVISQETIELGRKLEKKVGDFTEKRLGPQGFRNKFKFMFKNLFGMKGDSVKEIMEKAKYEMKKKEQEVSLIMVDSTPRDLPFVLKQKHEIYLKSANPKLHASSEQLTGKMKLTVKMDNNNIPKVINVMKGRQVITFSGLKKDVGFHIKGYLQEYFRNHTPEEVFHENQKTREQLTTEIAQKLQDKTDSYGVLISGLMTEFDPPAFVKRHRKIDKLRTKIEEIGLLRAEKKRAKGVARAEDIRAEGDVEAEEIKARGYSDAEKFAAEAESVELRREAEAKKVRAEGDSIEKVEREKILREQKRRTLKRKAKEMDNIETRQDIMVDEERLETGKVKASMKDEEMELKEKEFEQHKAETKLGKRHLEFDLKAEDEKRWIETKARRRKAEQDRKEKEIKIEQARKMKKMEEEQKLKERRDKHDLKQGKREIDIEAKEKFLRQKDEWNKLKHQEKMLEIDDNKRRHKEELAKLRVNIEHDLLTKSLGNKHKREKIILKKIDKHKLKEDYKDARFELKKRELQRKQLIKDLKLEDRLKELENEEKQIFGYMQHISSLEDMKIDQIIKEMRREQRLDEAKKDAYLKRISNKREIGEEQLDLFKSMLEQYGEVKETFNVFNEGLENTRKGVLDILDDWENFLKEDYNRHRKEMDEKLKEDLKEFDLD